LIPGFYAVESSKWDTVDACSQPHSTLQIDNKENLYLFGGVAAERNSHLAIYNTSKKRIALYLTVYQGKNFMYQIKRRTEVPPPCSGAFSAVYNNKMVIFGALYSLQEYNVEQIYSLSLGICPMK